MSARLPVLAQTARSAATTSEWRVTLTAAIGEDLANKVNACSLDGGRLTVFTESSSWAARLRFALAEAESRLRELTPEIQSLAVRVRPAPRKANRA
jgi:hypothetical protein